MITSKERYYTFEYAENPSDPVLIYLNQGTALTLHVEEPHLLANDVASFTAFLKIASSSPTGILFPPKFTFTGEIFNWETFIEQNKENSFFHPY